LRAIFGEKASDVRDTSLRVPPGVQGTIVEVRVFNRHGVDKTRRALAIERKRSSAFAKDRDDGRRFLDRNVYGRLAELFGKPPGHRRSRRASRRTPRLRRACSTSIRVANGGCLLPPNDKLMTEIEAMRKPVRRVEEGLEQRFLDKVEKLQRGDELPPGVMKMVKVFVA